MSAAEDAQLISETGFIPEEWEPERITVALAYLDARNSIIPMDTDTTSSNIIYIPDDDTMNQLKYIDPEQFNSLDTVRKLRRNAESKRRQELIAEQDVEYRAALNTEISKQTMETTTKYKDDKVLEESHDSLATHKETSSPLTLEELRAKRIARFS